MTTANRFAEYTRSTAFSMSLSARMIDRVLLWSARAKGWEISTDLATRFDWYHPDGPPGFGPRWGAEEIAAGSDGTTKSLYRRGLAEVRAHEVYDLPLLDGDEPDPPQLSHYWDLTDAGRVMGQLLELAGFDGPPVKVTPVRIHPDDRPKIRYGDLTDPDNEVEWEVPHDRRWDLMGPGDDRWFDSPGRRRAEAVTRP